MKDNAPSIIVVIERLQRDNSTTAISLGKGDGRGAESVNRDYSQIAACKRPVVRFGIAG